MLPLLFALAEGLESELDREAKLRCRPQSCSSVRALRIRDSPCACMSRPVHIDKHVALY